MKTIVKDIRRVYLIVIAIGMLFSVPVIAQNDIAYSDVDSIGDLWVITLDKSASMKENFKNRRGVVDEDRFKQECNKILNIIGTWGLKDSINFKVDRFFFYNTGLCDMPYKKYISISGNRISKILSVNSSFTDLFIHESGEQYRTFKNYREFKNTMKKKLDCQYNYRLSYVSQIRVCALDKTLSYLLENQKGDSFRNIYILTITDDADANDQWKNDYRSLRQNSYSRLKELNNLQNRLIYNELSGHGGGELKELRSNDHYNIHVYFYKYVTRQQQKLENEQKIIDDICYNISATNPNSGVIDVTLDIKNSVDWEPLYWNIDSIKINEKTILIYERAKQIGTPFHIQCEESDISDMEINHACIYGTVQLSYTDSIYGKHQKKIHYACDAIIISHTQHKTAIVLVWIFILLFISIVVYATSIRPRLEMMTIYLPGNDAIRVSRGHPWSYNTQVPLLLKTSDEQGRYDFLAHKSRWIKRTHLDGLNLADGKIVFTSKKQLTLPNGIFIGDIYDRFLDCSNEMPDGLRYDYQYRFYKTLIQMYKRSSIWGAKFIKTVIIVFGKMVPRYYYWYDFKKQQDVAVQSDFNKRTIFTINCTNEQLQSHNLSESYIYSYYLNNKIPAANIIICNTSHHTHQEIDVFLLEQTVSGVTKINEVFHAYHYSLYEGASLEIIANTINRLKKYLKQKFPNQKIQVMCESDLVSWDGICHFHITKPIYNNFLLIVEQTSEPKCLLLYSPFDKQNSYVTIKPMGSPGLLYSSPFPTYDFIISKQLSKDPIRILNGNIHRLEFVKDRQTIKSIIVGQNSVKI